MMVVETDFFMVEYSGPNGMGLTVGFFEASHRFWTRQHQQCNLFEITDSKGKLFFCESIAQTTLVFVIAVLAVQSCCFISLILDLLFSSFEMGIERPLLTMLLAI